MLMKTKFAYIRIHVNIINQWESYCLIFFVVQFLDLSSVWKWIFTTLCKMFRQKLMNIFFYSIPSKLCIQILTPQAWMMQGIISHVQEMFHITLSFMECCIWDYFGNGGWAEFELFYSNTFLWDFSCTAESLCHTLILPYGPWSNVILEDMNWHNEKSNLEVWLILYVKFCNWLQNLCNKVWNCPKRFSAFAEAWQVNRN